jgi:hypothetical protein
VQVFAPQWPDGDFVARTYIVGRAVGNMRQPNHLSSLLICAIVAAVWLGDARVVRRWVGHAMVLLFVFVVVLSGSRTGALSVGLLALWAVLDRRLSRPARALLLLLPVAYGVFWLGASAWADYGHHVFGGESRFSTKGDISSSRVAIWSNTIGLIRMHPWAGVGFGEFNFAWTLTPFPGRPVAFFDHTHNLALQLVVELGVPLGTLVLALLLWALWRALRAALEARADADAAQAPLRRAAFMMVLLILLHSLLEYPLWYAYFLLPTAFAFGLCLGGPAAAPRAATRALPADAPGGTRPLLVGALLLLLGGMASVLDYSRVVVIFAPGDAAAPLAERIADGERSVLFAHQADYAAATTAAQPADAIGAFRRAPHNLLDARLMLAWAKALHAVGETERAQYIAQRLAEFHNDQAADFFAPCAEPPVQGEPAPFQCVAPTRSFGYADFR